MQSTASRENQHLCPLRIDDDMIIGAKGDAGGHHLVKHRLRLFQPAEDEEEALRARLEAHVGANISERSTAQCSPSRHQVPVGCLLGQTGRQPTDEPSTPTCYKITCSSPLRAYPARNAERLQSNIHARQRRSRIENSNYQRVHNAAICVPYTTPHHLILIHI
ncbi:hypothetical protein AX14_012647 [Amanita brunnescens Koide BX004]|nr:hypothetical protein AX14_012647 [Amanita brunnescens Koide BX004]